MSADTLTDAEARTLRLAVEGYLRGPSEAAERVRELQRRGLLCGGTLIDGQTPTSAGREALARHEARYDAANDDTPDGAACHTGSRWVAPGEVDRPQLGMDGQVIDAEAGDRRG
jgi:hypothetical protein